MTRCRGHAVGLLIVVAGCASGGGTQPVSLEASDPSDRIRAIVAATDQGEGDLRSTVAALVDRLEDEDEAVRFYAIAGLDRLTGQRWGYRAYDPAPRRRVAVERWRRNLADGSFGAEPPG